MRVALRLLGFLLYHSATKWGFFVSALLSWNGMMQLLQFFSTHTGQYIIGGSIPLAAALLLLWLAPKRRRW
ncbi:hypothetical protein [Brucella pseudogrignonensis]|uniref:hypothetical protein n=1 Tax=Brucella pseudogrignonensis TaxID=419475 RepID=UPI003ED0C24D